MATRKTTSRNKNRENVVVWITDPYSEDTGKYLPQHRLISTSEWHEKELAKKLNRKAKTSAREMFQEEVDYWSQFPEYKTRDIIKASYVTPTQKERAHRNAHLQAFKEQQSGKYLNNLHPDPNKKYNPKEDFSKDPIYNWLYDGILADYALRNRRRDNRGKPPLLRRGLTYRITGRSKRR